MFNRMMCCLLLMISALLVAACSGKPQSRLSVRQTGSLGDAPSRPAGPDIFNDTAEAGGGQSSGSAGTDRAALDVIAETERSRAYRPGLGIAESSLRESAGDYAGAVIAVFKDLCWAYSTGAVVDKSAINAGLNKVKEVYRGPDFAAISEAERADAINAAEAAMLFNNERYREAKKYLPRSVIDNEPDGFGRWMELVCVLEDGDATDADRAAYGAIRARYERFPAYWHHGARTLPLHLANDYAERCVNSAPKGPYAYEARCILAQSAGLPASEGRALLSTFEIESIVVEAVNAGNPDLLMPLMPLIALDDNPWTLFASGALRALASKDEFREWFVGKERDASKSPVKKNRLADRLRYIARG